MTPGRPPLGAKLAQHLEGDQATKQRLEVILQTLSGELAVADACQKLGISQARFFELRATMLEAALASLEPKPPGRPPHPIDPQLERIQELEAQIQDLRVHLAAAQIREEIALAMPHLRLRNKPAPKKTTPKNKPVVRPDTLSITQPPSETSTDGSTDT